MPSGDILDARGAHDPLTWLDDWAPFVDAYGEDLEGYDAENVDVYSAELYGWRGVWPPLAAELMSPSLSPLSDHDSGAVSLPHQGEALATSSLWDALGPASSASGSYSGSSLQSIPDHQTVQDA